MTKLICNVQDIVGEPISSATVAISSENIQATGQVTLLPSFQEEPVKDGVAVFDKILPGRVVIRVTWADQVRTIRAYVPDSVEAVTLSELVLQIYDGTPTIVSQVSDAAIRAEKGLVELRKMKTSASESATQARKSEAGAKVSETNAKASEKESTAQAELSKDAATQAIAAAETLTASRNILTLDGAVAGMTLTSDGSLDVNPTRVTTDFIPVEPSTEYTWSTDGMAVEGQDVIFQRYAADKSNIGGLSVSAAFTTTSATTFIRASIRTPNAAVTQLEKGTTPTRWLPPGGVGVADVALTGVPSVAAALDDLDERIDSLDGGGEVSLVEDPPGSGLFVIGA